MVSTLPLAQEDLESISKFLSQTVGYYTYLVDKVSSGDALTDSDNKILDILGWSAGREVDALITADDVTNGRPAPDMITLAMDKFGIEDSKQVLKAGDSGIGGFG